MNCMRTALLATAITMTGCASMSNGKPSATEGTIKKWNTMDNAAQIGARPNWQYRIIEIKSTKNEQVLYTYDLSEKVNLFKEMYVRLQEGKYEVKTQCYLSRPNQATNAYTNTESHTVDIQAMYSTNVTVVPATANNGCKAKFSFRMM